MAGKTDGPFQSPDYKFTHQFSDFVICKLKLLFLLLNDGFQIGILFFYSGPNFFPCAFPLLGIAELHVAKTVQVYEMVAVGWGKQAFHFNFGCMGNLSFTLVCAIIISHYQQFSL